MAETCYLCEYKRLAREALEVLATVSDLVRLIDLEASDTFWHVHDRLLNEFLQMHQKQRRETEAATTTIKEYRVGWE